jgi:histone H3/H4
VQFFPSKGPLRFSPGAIEALIIASEAKLVHFMRSINYIACERGGKTITLKDVRTFKALEKIKPV